MIVFINKKVNDRAFDDFSTANDPALKHIPTDPRPPPSTLLSSLASDRRADRHPTIAHADPALGPTPTAPGVRPARSAEDQDAEDDGAEGYEEGQGGSVQGGRRATDSGQGSKGRRAEKAQRVQKEGDEPDREMLIVMNFTYASQVVGGSIYAQEHGK